jgi:hypothetical protein
VYIEAHISITLIIASYFLSKQYQCEFFAVGFGRGSQFLS